MASCLLPGCDLEGRTYRLELSRDPQSLRPRVPRSPGFPLIPCARRRTPHQPTCQAQVVPLRAPPGGDLHPFVTDRNDPHYCGVRVRVAQPAVRMGRRKESHLPAPVVAQRAQLHALRFSGCLCPSLGGRGTTEDGGLGVVSKWPGPWRGPANMGESLKIGVLGAG